MFGIECLVSGVYSKVFSVQSLVLYCGECLAVRAPPATSLVPDLVFSVLCSMFGVKF